MVSRHRSPGRPLKSSKPKKDERLFMEDIDELVFLRKPGESLAEVLHRVLAERRALLSQFRELGSAEEPEHMK